MRKSRIIWFLKGLSPTYWFQLCKLSRTWDKHLNKLLDSGEMFYDITDTRATLGGVEMWIGNHPYSSFTITVYGCKEVRPRRATIARAYSVLLQSKPECEKTIAEYLNSVINRRKGRK